MYILVQHLEILLHESIFASTLLDVFRIHLILQNMSNGLGVYKTHDVTFFKKIGLKLTLRKKGWSSMVK